MITTIDGVVKKRGEYVWAVGCVVSGKEYKPSLFKVHAQGQNNHDEYLKNAGCYDSYDLCVEKCAAIEHQFRLLDTPPIQVIMSEETKRQAIEYRDSRKNAVSFMDKLFSINSETYEKVTLSFHNPDMKDKVFTNVKVSLNPQTGAVWVYTDEWKQGFLEGVKSIELDGVVKTEE